MLRSNLLPHVGQILQRLQFALLLKILLPPGEKLIHDFAHHIGKASTFLLGNAFQSFVLLWF
jgi:hypothetical protein